MSWNQLGLRMISWTVPLSSSIWMRLGCLSTRSLQKLSHGRSIRTLPKCPVVWSLLSAVLAQVGSAYPLWLHGTVSLSLLSWQVERCGWDHVWSVTKRIDRSRAIWYVVSPAFSLLCSSSSSTHPFVNGRALIHYCPATIRSAAQERVILFSLPPNTIHLTLPLDKAFLVPLKAFWKQAKNPGKCVSIFLPSSVKHGCKQWPLRIFYLVFTELGYTHQIEMPLFFLRNVIQALHKRPPLHTYHTIPQQRNASCLRRKMIFNCAMRRVVHGIWGAVGTKNG